MQHFAVNDISSSLFSYTISLNTTVENGYLGSDGHSIGRHITKPILAFTITGRVHFQDRQYLVF